jgi:1-acyl-sn-glycerol-3-phosphate acyltransferase
VVEFLPVIGPGMQREAFLQELERRIETATDRLAAEATRTLPATPEMDAPRASRHKRL